MRERTVIALLCVSALAASAFCGEAPAKKAKARKRPPRPNPAMKPIEEVAGLPRVLLIGDSISIGYTIPTRKLLEGKANVHRALTNCGPTSKGVRSLDKWLTDKRLGSGKWDVIHFNWGLHDLKFMKDGKQQVPIDQYEKNLRELVGKLKQTGAKLIWASTTPVPEGCGGPKRLDADVVAYNEVAKKIMDENGIAIDDLYAFALPKLKEIQRPVNVHFSAQGSQALAEQVAAAIEEAQKK